MSQRVVHYLTLGKMKISLLASLSAFAGFIIARRGGALFPGIVAIFSGTLLLAMGASAINQFLERDIDAHMERTRGRPIPAGAISPSRALLASLVYGVSGAFLLYAFFGPFPALIGLFALAWYDGIYTFLKKATPFAVLPGAIVGALPPAMGWSAGGGSLLDPEIVILSFFFFMWQVPHFFLFMARYGKEYEKAGLPSATAILSERQIGRVAVIWVLSTAAAALLLPLSGAISGRATSYLLLAGTILFTLFTVPLLLRDRLEVRARRAFASINIYALLVILILSLDSLIVL